jgi:hypothetical protein
MEPRPPQPRSSHPFEPPASPETAGIGERLYPTPGEPAYYPGAEAYPPGAAAEPPLLPRRQRRQRGALRGIAVAVLTIGALLAVGWYFRDGVRGFVDPPAPTPTVAAQVAAPGTPAPAAESAALPNALATVTPTQVSEVSATATPGSDDESNVAQESGAGSEDTSAEPDRDISSETLPLLDLLPTQAEMPPGLVLADEAERSQAEVVASLGGTEEASQLLDEWGWSGNAFRDFIADAEAPPPTGTTFLNASVHRFADAQAANNAMVVFSDYVIFTQGLQNVDAPAIGDDAVLLVGAPDGIPLAVLYAQEGPILYRIGGSSGSAEADPTSDVLAVAGVIIPGQAPGD